MAFVIFHSYLLVLLPFHEIVFMKKYLFIIVLLLLYSCKETSENIIEQVSTSLVYPDYREVTIPKNIAPLSFRIQTDEKEVKTIFHTPNYSMSIKGKEVSPSIQKWHKLLMSNDTIIVDICIKKKVWEILESFPVYTSKDSIDPYITYRLIAPGYEVWNFMGIYQRELASYDETAIYENKGSQQFCVNCHTTNQGNPEEFLFHKRPKPNGTIIGKGGTIEKINTNFSEDIQALVYPSWHPSGNYIAFSVNKTYQGIHSADPNRIEVWDNASDIVILDANTGELLNIPILMSKDAWETFPHFSADGKTLYFSSAKPVGIPDSIKAVKYDICSIHINLEEKKIATHVDTIIHASQSDFSASFPRVSPDGKFLLYTKHQYGNFSIWHKDADLVMYNLQDKTHIDINNINSTESESYHSWSSNGHWVIFSSRREDGLYTRPYIAHVNENGTMDKPFILPQKKSIYYLLHDRSYNIPEFMKGKNNSNKAAIERLVEK